MLPKGITTGGGDAFLVGHETLEKCELGMLLEYWKYTFLHILWHQHIVQMCEDELEFLDMQLI